MPKKKSQKMTNTATLTPYKVAIIFGNFFVAFRIFLFYFRKRNHIPLVLTEKSWPDLVSQTRYTIFPEGMLTWNPMGKKKVAINFSGTVFCD